MAVSAMFGTAKYVQFGVLVFLEAEEVISRGNLQASKSDGYFIFLWELFSFYEKVPSPSNLAGFFRIFLPQPPIMFLTDLH